MTLQQKILLGIIIWLGGVALDVHLFPYVFILIYIGIALTFFEAIKWLLKKENRKRLREVFVFGGLPFTNDAAASFFSWRRISVLWTMCILFGMLIMQIGILMKQSDAYKVAIESIKTDNKIAERTGGIIQFTSTISGNVGGNETSKLEIGVIGQKESFWVTAYVDTKENGYVTTKLEIDE